MAMLTRVVTYDDLDNNEGASRVTFAYRGTSYEIDLGEEHQTELDQALAKFIAAARRTGPALTGRRIHITPPGRGRDLAAIRAWAREQGIPVSDKGRVPKEVQRAYAAAHGTSVPNNGNIAG